MNKSNISLAGIFNVKLKRTPFLLCSHLKLTSVISSIAFIKLVSGNIRKYIIKVLLMTWFLPSKLDERN